MVDGRKLAIAVTLVACAVAACGSDDSPDPSVDPTSSNEETTPVSPETDGSETAPIEPSLGPGQVALRFSGGSDTPPVVVNTEREYRPYGGFALLAGGGHQFRGLGLWNAVDVATNPCRNREWHDPGPSVSDLAEALAEQPLREATDPVAASVGGYQGLRITLTVPAGLRLADCDGGVFEDWRSPVSPHQHPAPAPGTGSGSSMSTDTACSSTRSTATAPPRNK